MSVYLSWINANPASTTRIYRDTSPINTSSLPAVLVTLNNNEQIYTDASAVFGTRYYYLIQVTKDGMTVYSKNVDITVGVDTGPGPSDLQWGDLFLGYFGTVNDWEIGVSISEWCNAAPGTNTFYKIYYQGRILYVAAPVINIGKSVTALVAAKLYNTGVISYGDTVASTGGAVRTYMGRNFAPRIAKLFDYANAQINGSSYSINFSDGMPYGRSEFCDIYRMTVKSLVRTVSAPFRFCHSTFASTAQTITSDYASTAKTVVAGFATVPSVGVIGIGITALGLSAASNTLIPVVEYLGPQS